MSRTHLHTRAMRRFGAHAWLRPGCALTHAAGALRACEACHVAEPLVERHRELYIAAHFPPFAVYSEEYRGGPAGRRVDERHLRHRV